MPTVLVVDDSPEAVRPLEKLLKHEGYNVLTAADAYSAAAFVRNQRPDLMLLDIGIPPVDGFTLLSLLRDEHLDDTPVILVTGHQDQHTADRAAELGVKAYMIKSQFTPDELLAAVKKHVKQPV
jgi:DNA-binding response OmpR family regulator